MNKLFRLAGLHSLLRKIQLKNELVSQIVIVLVFAVLMLTFLVSLDRYWQYTLEPRLYRVAETQAKLLAQAQAIGLVEILERKSRAVNEELNDAVEVMLILEDPAISDRFIRAVEIQLDESLFEGQKVKSEIIQGKINCENCFDVDIPLIGREGDIYGLAHFKVNDAYFSKFSSEMRAKLNTVSIVAISICIVLAALILVMFQYLHRARKSSEESDHAKTLFMANVTHELRTPLNSILGYTQIFKSNSNFMREYSEGINSIEKSADHLLLMINDILEFSRANEEGLELHPQEVNLPQFLKTIVEMTIPRAELKHLRYKRDFSPDLPEVIVADEKRLRQILLNLLGNAIKFTREGQVEFIVEASFNGNASFNVNSRTERCEFVFSVKDSGIGIDKIHLKQIFVPFRQLDNPITRAEGSGLGLAISEKLVQLMGSKLQVSSHLNKGSHFWFKVNFPVLQHHAVRSLGADALQMSEESLQAESEIPVPDNAVLEDLVAFSKGHNILAVRNIVAELRKDGQYTLFVEKVWFYVQQYRFKQLIEFIEPYLAKNAEPKARARSHPSTAGHRNNSPGNR